MTKKLNRRIDTAMEEDRPAKKAIRQWWLEAVTHRQASAQRHGVPYYLTLPGSQGLDIQMLVDNGIVKTTEAGPIETSEAEKLIAIEANQMACGKLRARFPGLTVREVNLDNLLSGSGIDAFPDNKTRRLCRAAVINLDFNGPWKLDDAGSGGWFNAVDKFGHMHEPNLAANRSAVAWTLCLTLRATFVGSADQMTRLLDFTRDQISGCPILCAWVDTHLGELLTKADRDIATIGSWTDWDMQLLFAVLVPLKVIHVASPRGWLVRCLHSACYGGGQQAAAMTTFVFQFEWDLAAQSSPAKTSRESREALPAAICMVRDDGTVEDIADS